MYVCKLSSAADGDDDVEDETSGHRDVIWWDFTDRGNQSRSMKASRFVDSGAHHISSRIDK